MQFITILAGHNFRPAECKTALAEAKRGEIEYRLELERDPSNAYDPNAIKVMMTVDDTDEPYFIGFVAGPDAALIAPYLDADESVRENNGNPLWTEDHVPSVERCEIIDWVSGDKKPTIVIEISTGFELGTLVKGGDADGDGDEDYLAGDEGEGDDD